MGCTASPGRPQALQQDDQAVSPVIGVVLMVAVTVVLAAVVFLLVNVDTDEATPNLVFQRNEARDELMLVRGTNGNWGDMRLFSPDTATGLRFALNAQPGLASPEVADGVQMPAAALTGGDVLAFCMDGGGSNIAISLVHTKSNTMMYQGEFLTIEACA